MGIRDARVRDRRRKDWYSVDNEILDDFAERIGLHGFAVYCALARYSWDGTEEASVSLTTLHKKLKMGRTKLVETLQLLEVVGLISIERGDHEHSNVYTLLEVPKRRSSTERYDPQYPSVLPPSTAQDPYKTDVQNSSKGNPYDLGEYLKNKGR